MNDIPGVGKGHRIADLLKDRQQMRERILRHRGGVPRPQIPKDVVQRGALDELHRVEGPVLFVGRQIVDRHDVRVFQLPRQFRFLREALEDLRIHARLIQGHFHGHGAIDAQIRGSQDGAHAAAGDFAAQRVAFPGMQLGDSGQRPDLRLGLGR